MERLAKAPAVWEAQGPEPWVTSLELEPRLLRVSTNIWDQMSGCCHCITSNHGTSETSIVCTVPHASVGWLGFSRSRQDLSGLASPRTELRSAPRVCVPGSGLQGQQLGDRSFVSLCSGQAHQLHKYFQLSASSYLLTSH